MAQTEYHPQGIENLIAAFAKSVCKDVVTLPPESAERKHAEKLLQSAYFEKLTGIEGKYLLKRLRAEYEERKHRKTCRTARQDYVKEYCREYYRQKKREVEGLKDANERISAAGGTNDRPQEP